jgi:hypothetical protein
MLFPPLHIQAMSVNLRPDPGFVYGMRYGAPVMIGWTALLFWADRKPVVRKDILLITAVFPVIGYYVFRVYGVVAGLVSFGQIVPTLVMQTVLLILLLNGYRKAQAMSLLQKGG